MYTGANRVIHFRLERVDGAGFGIEARFRVPDSSIAPFDLESSSQDCKRVMVGDIVVLGFAGIANGSQRARHWMAVVGSANVLMAGGTGLVADISDIGTNVAKRPVIQESRIGG